MVPYFFPKLISRLLIKGNNKIHLKCDSLSAFINIENYWWDQKGLASSSTGWSTLVERMCRWCQHLAKIYKQKLSETWNVFVSICLNQDEDFHEHETICITHKETIKASWQIFLFSIEIIDKGGKTQIWFFMFSKLEKCTENLG